MSVAPRIRNGPNVLCILCGQVANHVSLRCYQCRNNKWQVMPHETQADRDYLAWLRQRDAEKDA